MAQVVSGWALAWSGFLLAATAGSFGSEGFPLAPTLSLIVAVASAAVLLTANARLRAARHGNYRYFAAGGDAPGVLARRRAYEDGVRRARNILLASTLVLGVVFLVAISGFRCDAADICENVIPGALGISDATRVLTVVVGAVLIAAASLLRAHTTETDTLEIAIAAAERRDDGPMTTSRSRWE